MQELIHKDHKFEYYKVAMLSGKWMSSCSVVEACKAVGMKTVCEGPYYKKNHKHGELCKSSNEQDCYVTPVSGKGCGLGCPKVGFCGLTRLPGCGGINGKCEKFRNVFTYFGNYGLTHGVRKNQGIRSQRQGFAGPACAPCIDKNEKPDEMRKHRNNNGDSCMQCDPDAQGLDYFKSKTSFYAFCAKPVS